jgi:hypothetical protein
MPISKAMGHNLVVSKEADQKKAVIATAAKPVCQLTM